MGPPRSLSEHTGSEPLRHFALPQRRCPREGLLRLPVRRSRQVSSGLPHIRNALAAHERYIGCAHRVRVTSKQAPCLRRVHGPESPLFDILRQRPDKTPQYTRTDIPPVSRGSQLSSDRRVTVSSIGHPKQFLDCCVSNSHGQNDYPKAKVAQRCLKHKGA